jgi:hypothetical protein
VIEEEFKDTTSKKKALEPEDDSMTFTPDPDFLKKIN